MKTIRKASVLGVAVTMLITGAGTPVQGEETTANLGPNHALAPEVAPSQAAAPSTEKNQPAVQTTQQFFASSSSLTAPSAAPVPKDIKASTDAEAKINLTVKFSTASQLIQVHWNGASVLAGMDTKKLTATANITNFLGEKQQWVLEFKKDVAGNYTISRFTVSYQSNTKYSQRMGYQDIYTFNSQGLTETWVYQSSSTRYVSKFTYVSTSAGDRTASTLTESWVNGRMIVEKKNLRGYDSAGNRTDGMYLQREASGRIQITGTKFDSAVQENETISLGGGSELNALYDSVQNMADFDRVLQEQDRRDLVQRGSRIFSIDVTNPQDGNFDNAYGLSQTAGSQRSSLYLNWNQIETAPGIYNGSQVSFLGIANSYYAAKNAPVDLTLTAVHTNQLVLPDDLKGKRLDSPEVIARFKQLIDFIASQLSGCKIGSVVLISEYDIYAGNDADKWRQVTNFYAAVSPYAKSKLPSAKILAETTLGGLIGANKDRVKAINQYSDQIAVSYYAINQDSTVKNLDVFRKEFELLMKTHTEKPIVFLQLGYPSSPLLGSSEARQARFYKEVFRLWDKYAGRIAHIDFTWLHDRSPAEAQGYADFYGVNDPKYTAFLSSIGVRTYDGKDKLAYKLIKAEAAKRGW